MPNIHNHIEKGTFLRVGKENLHSIKIFFYILLFHISNTHTHTHTHFKTTCDLVVRISVYRSRGPGLIPGTPRFSEK
jgi:hypothetical protein